MTTAAMTMTTGGRTTMASETKRGEPKHTPGWWRRDGLTVFALTPNGRQNRFWTTVQSVGRSAEGEAAPAELLANAILIAAAPDLLDALRGLVVGLSQPGREKTRDALRAQYERAVSALAA